MGTFKRMNDMKGMIEAVPGDGTANPARAIRGQPGMGYPRIHSALARERQNTLLAEAQATHQARQARVHRRWHGTPAARRSPIRRTARRLSSAWGRLLTSRPESRSEAGG
jgi:hypothetical protein